MNNSKFVLNKLAKLFEQGLLTSKDLGNEILTILKSKRDEIVFKMKLTSKDEFDILSKRVENLEKKIDKLKIKKQLKTKQAKKS
jgi:23S rRNA C2498 (ribose-2'-O)-methylase RlmM